MIFDEKENKKPFPCSDCAYRADRSSTLKKHYDEVHLKIRPYKCQECDHGFFRNDKLLKHVNAVHKKIKSEICEICQQGFASRQPLLRHLAGHIVEIEIKNVDGTNDY
jgi:uncharacterized Zn-finger protein